MITADDDGIVTNVTNDTLSVIYKGDIKKAYKLGVVHGTVSGVTIPHTKITDLKAGHKFNKGDALVFNSGFFKRSEINPHNVVYMHGVITRVVLMENADTTEDSCVISQELSDKLSTPVTTHHGIIVDFTKVIHNLVKVGDHVEPDTILCTLENFIDESLVSKDASAIAALSKLSSNNPRAKVYGTITEIEVLYYGKIEDMNFSLQQIVNEYDTKRSKVVRKYDTDDAKTGKIDESIRVSGRKLLPNQLAIKIYIDGSLGTNTGDKLVFGNMLKSTIGRVMSDPFISEDGQPVDAQFGGQSVSHRIVDSPEISGLANTVMIKLSAVTGKMFRK